VTALALSFAHSAFMREQLSVWVTRMVRAARASIERALVQSLSLLARPAMEPLVLPAGVNCASRPGAVLRTVPTFELPLEGA
jgi:hypothetical protein